MITYEIYYNKVYAHSCNLVQQKIKGYSLYIDQVNELLLIDNVVVAKLKEINEIRFMVNGYYQHIHIAQPNAKIHSTDIPFPTEEGV